MAYAEPKVHLRDVFPSLSLDSPPQSDPPPPPSPIESLPQELIEQIAFQLCRQTPCGPPISLTNLLLVSRRFNNVLGPRNEGYYSDLFKERFDWKSVERRWRTMKNIEDKREKRALLEQGTEVRADVDLKLTYGSFTRPSSPSDIPMSDSPWRSLTSRDYALEFKRRCTVLTRMRRAARGGAIPPSSSRPGSPRLHATMTPLAPGEYKSPLIEADELTQNLWTAYLMLLENDSKNLPHLLDYGCLRDYMRLFYKHSLLSEALRPGWPRESAGRGLGLWIGWLGGDDLKSESSEESDQRFFVLKPYVFGAHRFDAFHVSWTIPDLPVDLKSHPLGDAPTDPFMADLRPRTLAQSIVHMGRRIEIAPPVLTHAAIFSFFHRVEQDPAAAADMAVLPGAPSHFMMGPGAGARVPGLTSVKPTKTPLPVLSSRNHDRDFMRLASCVDPYSSRGLPTLYCRGELNGSWEGRFSFFDFDSYRDMLGGRMRSLYEGPFGDQPQVWKLEEKVVRINRGQRQGGRGPILNAGYEIGQQGPRASQSPPPVTRALPTPTSPLMGGLGSRRKSIDGPGEWFDGRANKRPRSIEENMWEQEETGEEEDDGDYEILLTGSGHSAWGQFLLKGRVRSYDGMFSITKEYTPDSRGRWLYRGYCVGGTLVGRWRDTHTPIDLHGYEGQFIMTRRA